LLVAVLSDVNNVIGDADAQVYEYDDLYQLVFVDYNDAGDNTTHYDYDKLGSRVDVNTSGDMVRCLCHLFR